MPAKASRAAFGEALLELGARDDRIVTLDADLSKSTMTVKFAKTHGDRAFNIVGTHAGIAIGEDGYSQMGLRRRAPRAALTCASPARTSSPSAHPPIAFSSDAGSRFARAAR